MYKTIIFDVDGTLINTEKAVLGSLQKMLFVEFNKFYNFDELSFVLGIPGSSSLPQLRIKDIDRANDLWNIYMKEFSDSISVYPGIEYLLGQLHKQKIKIGIVTSKTRVELTDDFEPFKLMKYLSYVVCADDTNLHKPNPEPILKFLEISKANPQQSIYIGDTIYDAQCARDSGVSFGLAVWGADKEIKIHANHYFNTPNEILHYATR